MLRAASEGARGGVPCYSPRVGEPPSSSLSDDGDSPPSAGERAWTPLRRWTYAAKPASWPKLLVPFLLGQGIGAAAAEGFSLLGFAFGLGFTVLDTLYVVFLNDWSDELVDAIKRRRFPHGCSPKTIPDGILPARALLRAGLACGVLAFGSAVAVSVLKGSWVAAGLGGLGLLVFAAYSLPPLRLNYRGGGELLEFVGVGVLLPWFSAYLQAGELWMPQLVVVPGFAMLAGASAVASGLSDEQSDREGGKRTFTTELGNPGARRLVEALVLGGAIVWVATSHFLPRMLPPWVSAVALVVLLVEFRSMHQLSARAGTNMFHGQKRYKAHLHRAIWGAGAAMALLLPWVR